MALILQTSLFTLESYNLSILEHIKCAGIIDNLQMLIAFSFYVNPRTHLKCAGIIDNLQMLIAVSFSVNPRTHLKCAGNIDNTLLLMLEQHKLRKLFTYYLVMHFRIPGLAQMVHTDGDVALTATFNQTENMIVHCSRIKHVLV
jgi:hypothetical protein